MNPAHIKKIIMEAKTMKKTLKIYLSIFCVAALLMSTVVIPAVADTQNNTNDTVFQRWSFTNESHPNLSSEGASLVYGDDAQKIAICNTIIRDYGYETGGGNVNQKSIADGLYTVEHKNSSRQGISWINFKLDQKLVSGKTYKFDIGFYSENSTWVENVGLFCYTQAIGDKFQASQYDDSKSYFDTNNYTIHVKQSMQVSNSSDNRYSVEFTATETLATCDYLIFAYKVASTQKVATYHMCDAILTQMPDKEPEIAYPVLEENGDIFVGEWSFAGKTWWDSELNVDKPDYWDTNTQTVRTIADGKYTVYSENADGAKNIPLRLYFKLNEDLVAGKVYTLALNIYAGNSAPAWLDGGSSVFYSASPFHKGNKPIQSGVPLIPDGTDGVTAIGTSTNSGSVGLSADENNTLYYNITATADMVKDGYIGFAAKLAYYSKGTYVVKGAKLTGENVTPIVNYDFDVADTRESIFAHVAKGDDATTGATNSKANNSNDVDTYTPGSGNYNGITGLKKDRYQLIMAIPTEDINGEGAEIKLAANTEYKISLRASADYYGANVYAYAGNPEYFDADAKDNSYQIAKLGRITNGVDNPYNYNFILTTSGSSINFNTYSQLYIVIRPDDSETITNNKTVCYQLSIGKLAQKGVRRVTTPKVDKVRYNKIVLADDSFATYAIKNNTTGEYSEVDGNIAALLEADTEYTFKARYADNGRFIASEDYGDAITVKTLKFGDVNADSVVNIIDLVNMKKALSKESVDDIYDMNDDELINANDITALVNVILGK